MASPEISTINGILLAEWKYQKLNFLLYMPIFISKIEHPSFYKNKLSQILLKTQNRTNYWIKKSKSKKI